MLNDLLSIVASYLGLDEVSQYIDAVNIDETPENKPEVLDFLISLVNLTMRQITRDYMPLYKEEILCSDENCQINYSDFSTAPVQIKSVSYLDGISSTFRCFPSYIKVGYQNKKYLVKYSYTPSSVSDLDSEIEMPFGLKIETICFGVCYEYCISNELYSEADIWEERFKNSLLNDINGKRAKSVPIRGWV